LASQHRCRLLPEALAAAAKGRAARLRHGSAERSAGERSPPGAAQQRAARDEEEGVKAALDRTLERTGVGFSHGLLRANVGVPIPAISGPRY
jgi:hypothetical protein